MSIVMMGYKLIIIVQISHNNAKGNIITENYP